jgi:sterol desaturase/sphingolipid hydroxylase (fatty acid hydroxylase superfamily)
MTEPVLRLVAFGVILASLVLLERWRPWRAPSPGAIRNAGRNLLLGAAGAALVRVAIPLVAWQAAHWAAARDVGLLHALDWPIPLAAIIGFLALDAAIWAQHVASHRVRILWSLHAVHHSEGELSVTTGVRFHPVEILFSMIWKVVVVLVVGIPAVAVLVFEVVLNAGSLFTHANIRLAPALERWLGAALITPGMHREHHRPDTPARLRNYGFSLVLWDRLFGTFAPASAPDADVPCGLTPDRAHARAGFLHLLALPFVTSAIYSRPTALIDR